MEKLQKNWPEGFSKANTKRSEMQNGEYNGALAKLSRNFAMITADSVDSDPASADVSAAGSGGGPARTSSASKNTLWSHSKDSSADMELGNPVGGPTTPPTSSHRIPPRQVKTGCNCFVM